MRVTCIQEGPSQRGTTHYLRPTRSDVRLALLLPTLLVAIVGSVFSNPSELHFLAFLPGSIAVGLYWVRWIEHPSQAAGFAAFAMALTSVITTFDLALALGLGLANGVEVGLACIGIRAVLGFRRPHLDYVDYLRFIVLIAAVPSIVAATIGASVHLATEGSPWGTVLINWLVLDLACLATIPGVIALLSNGRCKDLLQAKWSFHEMAAGLAFLGVFILAEVMTSLQFSVIILFPVLGILAVFTTLRAAVFSSCALWFGLALVDLSTTASPTYLYSIVAAGVSSPLIFVCSSTTWILFTIVLRQLRDAREMANVSRRLKAESLASLSHDVRTPLNAVTGMFELLKASDLPPRQASYVDAGGSAAQKLLKQVTEVFDVIRLEAKAISLFDSEILIDELRGDWSRRLEASIKSHKKILSHTVAATSLAPKVMFADSARLNQVASCLIDNAVRFTETGHIEIKFDQGRTKDTISISFQDTGHGIARDRIGAIFDRFRQLDASAGRKRQWPGFGLSISRDLIELMQGELSASSTLGKGTTFTVVLPLARSVETSNDK